MVKGDDPASFDSPEAFRPPLRNGGLQPTRFFMEQLFQFYPAPVTKLTEGKEINLKEVYQYITLDADALTNTYRLRALWGEAHAGKRTLKEVRDYKAEHFDYVCFSGTFRARGDEGLIQHSGLICLDFDHVGTYLQTRSLREKLVADRYFTTWMMFTSPSGDGFKWVVGIDLTKCDHRTWFQALRNYLRITYGLEADAKCINVSRACFLPYDANCYVHPEISNQPDVCPY